MLHKDVAEAAVVGYPHKIKGQGLYAFVALNKNVESSHVLEMELLQWVKQEIAQLQNRIFYNSQKDYKTRSGKLCEEF